MRLKLHREMRAFITLRSNKQSPSVTIVRGGSRIDETSEPPLSSGAIRRDRCEDKVEAENEQVGVVDVLSYKNASIEFRSSARLAICALSAALRAAVGVVVAD